MYWSASFAMCQHRGAKPLPKIQQNGQRGDAVTGHEGMALNGQKVGLDGNKFFTVRVEKHWKGGFLVHLQEKS